MKNCDLSVYDVFEYEMLKTLYINRDWCRDATLYRDNEGKLVIFWQWMEAHGVGQDHYSKIVESVADLKKCLYKDVERGLLTQRKADKAIDECRCYFEKEQ